jgi:hypothetical protein
MNKSIFNKILFTNTKLLSLGDNKSSRSTDFSWRRRKKKRNNKTSTNEKQLIYLRINQKDFPEIMWKEQMTKQTIHQDKFIAVRILASISTSDQLIDQEASATWNDICEINQEDPYTIKAIEWQKLLQNCLKTHAYDQRQQRIHQIEQYQQDNNIIPYDLVQSENLSFKIPSINTKEYPGYIFISKLMKVNTHQDKTITIKILAPISIDDNYILQQSQIHWKYVCQPNWFKSNIQRGLKWQELLQNNLIQQSIKLKPSIKISYEENIKLVKQAIRVKKEPNTTLTEVIINNNDEEIETITID